MSDKYDPDALREIGLRVARFIDGDTADQYGPDRAVFNVVGGKVTVERVMIEAA